MLAHQGSCAIRKMPAPEKWQEHQVRMENSFQVSSFMVRTLQAAGTTHGQPRALHSYFLLHPRAHLQGKAHKNAGAQGPAASNPSTGRLQALPPEPPRKHISELTIG